MEWLTGALVVLGGLEWGMIGFFKYDLLSHLFTVGSAGYRTVTAIVGAAALYAVGDVLFRISEPQDMAHAH